MKFIVDTEKKTIELIEPCNISELVRMIDDMVDDIKDWSITTPMQPFTVFPQYPTPPMPWEITCTAGTVAKAAENPESAIQQPESSINNPESQS